MKRPLLFIAVLLAVLSGGPLSFAISPSIYQSDLPGDSAYTFGARGDGTTDNRTVLNTLSGQSGKRLVFRGGTYKVSSNVTLSADNLWAFGVGAKLKPASGVTITLPQTFEAGPTQVFDTSLGGTVAFSRNPERILPQWWGAVGDGETDDRAAIQAAIDAAADGAIIDLTAGSGWEISEALYIDKPLTIRFAASAPIYQTTWGKPHLYIDQTDDVRFEGVCRLRYEGSRTALSTPPATSPDARMLAVYQEATFSVAANVENLATGVILRYTCDRFRADTIDVYGQVAGVAHLTEGTEVNYAYSADNHISNLFVHTVDFGYRSGGFKRFTVDNMVGTNITCTQGDPSHVIYVGGQTTKNGLLSIGTIQLDGAATIADASDALHITDAFSIKDTSQFHIGNVLIEDSQYIGNANNATGRIESITAILLELTDGAGATDHATVFTAQNGSRVSIGSVDIVTALRQTGGAQSGVFHCSGASKIDVDRGRVEFTATNPGRVGIFLASADIVLLNNLEIVYDASKLMTMSNPAAVYVNSSLASVTLRNPTLRGETRLFYNAASNSLWSVEVDPNRLIAGNNADAIIDASGSYRVKFISLPITPPTATWDGTSNVQFRSRNIIATANTINSTLAGASGFTEGQRYRVVNGDSGKTTISNSASVKTRDGLEITRGAWNWVDFNAVNIGGTLVLSEAARG